jgi:hypothetical protein
MGTVDKYNPQIGINQMRNTLTLTEKKEIADFGCTVAQMRDAVKEGLARRYLSPHEYVLALLEAHICERLNGDSDEAAQTLNRANWIWANYCVNPQLAA